MSSALSEAKIAKTAIITIAALVTVEAVRADAAFDCLVGRHALVDELLDSAEDEDVVVHREAEEDREEEER